MANQIDLLQSTVNKYLGNMELPDKSHDRHVICLLLCGVRDKLEYLSPRKRDVDLYREIMDDINIIIGSAVKVNLSLPDSSGMSSEAFSSIATDENENGAELSALLDSTTVDAPSSTPDESNLDGEELSALLDSATVEAPSSTPDESNFDGAELFAWLDSTTVDEPSSKSNESNFDGAELFAWIDSATVEAPDLDDLSTWFEKNYGPPPQKRQRCAPMNPKTVACEDTIEALFESG